LAYKIKYKSSIKKDLKKIDKKQCLRLLNKIERELRGNPDRGKELIGDYRGLYSLRVGDYRIIYSLLLDNIIMILRIAHRKDAYR